MMRSFTTFLLCCGAVGVFAASDATMVARDTSYIDTYWPYLEYLPGDYHDDPYTLRPLIVFLHGAGEDGGFEGLYNTLHDRGPNKLIDKGNTFFDDNGVIVISPRAKNTTERWNFYGTDVEFTGFINDLIANYPIDTTRIYLTGYSMGAGGALWAATEEPELYAGLLLCCNGDERKRVWNMGGIPMWMHHGTEDLGRRIRTTREWVDASIVASSYVYRNVFDTYPTDGNSSAGQNMTGRLLADNTFAWADGVIAPEDDVAAGIEAGSPYFTYYHGKAHNVWDVTYNNMDTWRWLLDQRINLPDPYGLDYPHIPCAIEAEHYDRGGEGVAYHDLDSANSGGAVRPDDGVDIASNGTAGAHVTGIEAGEWLAYAVDVPDRGAYKLTLRVRTVAAVTDAISVRARRRSAARPISLPDTGGGWQKVHAYLRLEEGMQRLEFVFFAGGFDLDSFELEYGGMIVDSSMDEDLTSKTGSWWPYHEHDRIYGVDFRYETGTGCYINFKPRLARDGEYLVREWHNAGVDPDVVVKVKTTDGTLHTLSLDQTVNKEQWVDIGTWEFTPSDPNATDPLAQLFIQDDKVYADAFGFFLQPKPQTRRLSLSVSENGATTETQCLIAQGEVVHCNANAFIHLATELACEEDTDVTLGEGASAASN